MRGGMNELEESKITNAHKKGALCQDLDLKRE